MSDLVAILLIERFNGTPAKKILRAAARLKWVQMKTSSARGVGTVLKQSVEGKRFQKALKKQKRSKKSILARNYLCFRKLVSSKLLPSYTCGLITRNLSYRRSQNLKTESAGRKHRLWLENQTYELYK